jgi:hypothetical protein
MNEIKNYIKEHVTCTYNEQKTLFVKLKKTIAKAEEKLAAAKNRLEKRDIYNNLANYLILTGNKINEQNQYWLAYKSVLKIIEENKKESMEKQQ